MFQRVVSSVKKEIAAFDKAYAEQFNGEINTLLSNYRPAEGKHLRPILFFLIQGLYNRKPPQEKSIPLAVMIELIHDASLVHDDVIDEAELRRGIPTLHVSSGQQQLAVLFGDFLFARALILGARYKNVKVMELISGAVLTMSQGALREFRQTFNLKQEVYLKIIREKTADYFGIISKIAGIVQNADGEALSQLQIFGENFGMAFQIHDDILDYTGSSEILKKPVNHDLSNGILTLPLILALEACKPGIKNEALLKIKSNDEEKFSWLRNFVHDKRGLEKAARIADTYSNRAGDVLNSFSDSSYKKSLETLMEYEKCRLS